MRYSGTRGDIFRTCIGSVFPSVLRNGYALNTGLSFVLRLYIGYRGAISKDYMILAGTMSYVDRVGKGKES